MEGPPSCYIPRLLRIQLPSCSDPSMAGIDHPRSMNPVITVTASTQLSEAATKDFDLAAGKIETQGCGCEPVTVTESVYFQCAL
jgi:hypothetical protein